MKLPHEAWPSVAPAPAPAAARWLDAALEALEALASEELGALDVQKSQGGGGEEWHGSIQRREI